MGNNLSQLEAGKKINGPIDVKLTEDAQKNDWFGESQNQAIGITEISSPTIDEFEISWLIKDWSSVSQSTDKLEFLEFSGGPLTNHLWSLELVIKKNANIEVFARLKGIAGSAECIESICWLSLFLNDGENRKRCRPTNIYQEIKIGGYFSNKWDWPFNVENDSIRIHCTFRVKIPLKPDWAKNTLITAHSSPLLTQPSNDALIQAFGSLFQSKDHADLKLVVGDIEISAHKAILSARSPIFAAMLAAPMMESEDGRVFIEDFGPNVVNAMLKFIYTGNVDVNDASAEDLFLIAEKYQLSPELKNGCETKLISELDIPNVFHLYLFAERVSAQRLKTNAMKFIHRNLNAVVETEEYQKILKSNPEIMTELLLGSNPNKRVKYS